MQDFVTLSKALGDETRLRVLMLLSDGELCLCQLIAVLGLSPSTVSKHVSLLASAGLLSCRKQGRWHYYKLMGKDASPAVRQGLKWVKTHLADERDIQQDREKLAGIADQPLEDVSCCYRK